MLFSTHLALSLLCCWVPGDGKSLPPVVWGAICVILFMHIYKYRGEYINIAGNIIYTTLYYINTVQRIYKYLLRYRYWAVYINTASYIIIFSVVFIYSAWYFLYSAQYLLYSPRVFIFRGVYIYRAVFIYLRR